MNIIINWYQTTLNGPMCSSSLYISYEPESASSVVVQVHHDMVNR